MHWSSLVECMIRVPSWPWTKSAYVCTYYSVCDWPYSKMLLLVFDVCSMGPYVISPHSCVVILFSEYAETLINDGSCMNLHCLSVWHGCRVGPGQTASTFAAIANVNNGLALIFVGCWYVRSCYSVCNWPFSKLLLVFDVSRGCNVILPGLYAILLFEYTTTAIITAFGTGACRAGPGRTACTFVPIIAACAIDLTRNCYYWWSLDDAVWGRM